MSQQGPGDVVALLPCPFCGEKPYTNTRRDEDLATHNFVEWTDVGCHHCGVSFSLPTRGYDETATAQWNRRTLLSSSRGEQGWLSIECAPKTRPIIGKTAAGRIVKAKWVRLDDDNAGWGTPEEDDPRPNCWDDGFCWASNSDELPSDPLVAYIEMPGSVPTSLAGQVPDGLGVRAATLLQKISAAPQPTAGGDAPLVAKVAHEIAVRYRPSESELPFSPHSSAIWQSSLEDAISDALSAERARVIAQIEALVKDKWQAAYDNMERAVSNEFKTALDMRQAAIANILDDIRALGQGGSNA
jgi:Lar family restriction alleviation protein